MTPAQQHKAHAPRHVRVYVLTVSDTRTEENDEGWSAASFVESFGAHGRRKNDCTNRRQAVMGRLPTSKSADVIISTGGNWDFAPRQHVEAVSSLFGTEADGFGELFRYLSRRNGSLAMLSRAVAGLCRGLVICGAGFAACGAFGDGKLIGPELGHLKFEARR